MDHATSSTHAKSDRERSSSPLEKFLIKSGAQLTNLITFLTIIIKWRRDDSVGEMLRSL